MHTRDGVRLDADVYYPEDEGRFPVLLMRQPYGRAIASTVVYAHPSWYASQGYIVVIQDVRGRGSSEGVFQLFAHEAEDGADAVAWAAGLPGSTGQVGMYGFSYQGMTQLYAAAAAPPALKVLAPAMVGYDLYADWAYENGALLLQAGLGWAIQLAAETARRQGDEAAFNRLYAASRDLPLSEAIAARPQVLSQLAADSFFHDWLDHPYADDYWQTLKPDLSRVDLPMLHVGGWFDPYLRGSLRLYQEMKGRGTTPQQLWVGPWGHLPWSRWVGAVDFGPKAISPIDRLQIRWFDQFLKRKNTGLLREDPVSLFEMGTNQWRTFAAWPEGDPQLYYLTSTGLAGMREDVGKLEAEFPLAPPEPDVLVHDPWRPVPSLGGHAGIPSGSFERSAIDGRSDVLTYTTEPFEAAVAIAGTVQLDLRCRADTPSFDVCAVLSEVRADGRVFNLTQGYQRVARPETERGQPLTLSLQPTCFAIPKGHALRLSLSAACFPAYAVNAGTGKPAGDSPQIDCRTITLTVNPPRSAPSKLRLPLVGPPLP
ncbi:MAG: CocE/NonD family hydrolase [Cyanobacteria bacterium Co-bin13]|nr:CocE/NonD family hydrolase [Cyanobacteria bacterium Co-bin13]